MVPVLNIESCSRTAAPQSFELTSFTLYACGGNRQRRTSNEVYANFTRSDRTLYFEIRGEDMVPVKIHKILFFRTQQLSQTRASPDDPKTK
ncbi:hypothetical protein EV126DRAFT_437750 [Verticillium dahliae]|nr:hypothetical protein EV126DRAFT_437750 [Verticillium dahliae]